MSTAGTLGWTGNKQPHRSTKGALNRIFSTFFYRELCRCGVSCFSRLPILCLNLSIHSHATHTTQGATMILWPNERLTARNHHIGRYRTAEANDVFVSSRLELNLNTTSITLPAVREQLLHFAATLCLRRFHVYVCMSRHCRILVLSATEQSKYFSQKKTN